MVFFAPAKQRVTPVETTVAAMQAQREYDRLGWFQKSMLRHFGGPFFDRAMKTIDLAAVQVELPAGTRDYEGPVTKWVNRTFPH
jgi:hypothetical protein